MSGTPTPSVNLPLELDSGSLEITPRKLAPEDPRKLSPEDPRKLAPDDPRKLAPDDPRKLAPESRSSSPESRSSSPESRSSSPESRSSSPEGRSPPPEIHLTHSGDPVVPFLNFNGRLSEGITYNPSNHTLLWVDIIAGDVHRVFLSHEEYTPKVLQQVTATHEVVPVPDSVGVIGLTPNPDVYVCGCQFGLGVVDFAKKNFAYIKRYPHATSRLRSNDGTVDAAGNFWVGTMSDFAVGAPAPEGSLWRIGASGAIDEMLTACTIPNGLAFGPRAAFWTESLAHTVWRFDYDGRVLTNKRPHIELKRVLPQVTSPEPDGMTRLPNGDMYVAVYSAARVLHFDAQARLVRLFVFPALRITCVTFGGVAGDEMFVTSANLHLDDPSRLAEGAARGDYGGAIFRVKVPGVLSAPKHVWRGPLTPEV